MKSDRPPTRFEILPGGRDDGWSEDWRVFCERIGWQQLTEPSLTDDYEDQLALRVFGRRDQLISLDAERARRALAPAEDSADEAPRRRRWMAVAIVAIAVISAVAALWHRGDAPTADTVPQPVPEIAPAPIEPEPDETTEPDQPSPDPGMRQLRARRALPEVPPAVERVVGEPRVGEAMAEAQRVQAQLVEAQLIEGTLEPGLPPISADAAPFAHPPTSATPPTSVALPPRVLALVTAASRDASGPHQEALVPRREHLAAAAALEAAATRAVALVDVLEAGRQLGEQL